jgi:hypothetical protein
MVKKENLTPPDPSDMMQVIWSKTTAGGDQISSINGLRMSEDDTYMDFCVNFMPCICTDEEWKRNSKNKRASDFIQTSLEAFGIVSYVNGYDVWKSRYTPAKVPTNDENDDVSALTRTDESDDTFKFTSNARGSKKYAGWSPKGMDLYNKIQETLVEQRGNETSGSIFDDKLMKRLTIKRKRSAGNGDSHAAPRATNNLAMLLSTN